MTVNTPLQAASHPQMLARDMIIEMDDPNVGKFKGFGIPVKFSETPGNVDKASPLLGEDTCAVLKEIGYGQDEIDSFIENEIVGIPEE